MSRHKIKIYVKDELVKEEEGTYEYLSDIYNNIAGQDLTMLRFNYPTLKRRMDFRLELWEDESIIRVSNPTRSITLNKDKTMQVSNSFVRDIYKCLKYIKAKGIDNLISSREMRSNLFDIENVIKRVPSYLDDSSRLANGLDYMMAPIIEYLNKRGIETVFSCDGHFKDRMEINFKGFIDPKVLFKCGLRIEYWTNRSGIEMTKLTADGASTVPGKFRVISEFVSKLESINFEYVSFEGLHGYPHVDMNNYRKNDITLQVINMYKSKAPNGKNLGFYINKCKKSLSNYSYEDVESLEFMNMTTLSVVDIYMTLNRYNKITVKDLNDNILFEVV